MSKTAKVLNRCRFSHDGREVNWFSKDQVVKDDLADKMVKFELAEYCEVEEDITPDFEALTKALDNAKDNLKKSRANDKSHLEKAVADAENALSEALGSQ